MKIQIKSDTNSEILKLQAESGKANAELKNETIVTGGGSNDYNVLVNKPQINGVRLEGNKSGEEIGFEILTNKEIESILK